VFIKADRQVLTAVVMNLLQNAFKFTKPGTMVVLRVRASVDGCSSRWKTNAAVSRVRVSITCSAPSSNAAPIEAALGLGLAFSRRAVEASNGRIYAHNVPAKGGVFTIDLHVATNS
jgi:signal transduction histidine kinase